MILFQFLESMKFNWICVLKDFVAVYSMPVILCVFRLITLPLFILATVIMFSFYGLDWLVNKIIAIDEKLRSQL